MDRLHPGSAFYVVARAFRLSGPVDTGALQVALDRLAERHDGLRTRLVDGPGGEPEQVVDPDAHVPLRFTEANEVGLPQLLVQEGRRPFRLDHEAPLRAVLARLGEDDHALLLAVHHSAADGWSLPVLYRDLARAYGAALDGTVPTWGPAPLRTVDYAHWQRGHSRAQDPHLAYWRTALRGAPPLLALPTDSPRPDTTRADGARASVDYAPGLGDALDAYARREGATPFVVALAVYFVVLARRSGEPDLVVGVNTSGRERVGAEDAVGLYVNMMAVRAQIDLLGTWREALDAVREAFLGGLAHASAPFDHVVEAVRPPRQAGAAPLVQTVFSVDDVRDQVLGLPRVRETRIPLDLGTATFDLVVDLVRDDDSTRGVVEYRTDLFHRDTAASLMTDYGVTLETVVGGPNRSLADLGPIVDGARTLARSESAASHGAARRQALRSLRRP